MLEKLKILLGIEDEEKDPVLSFCLDMVTDAVKNYCNLEEIPPQLETTVIRMAAGCYNSGAFAGNADGQEQQTGEVASVKRGDVTVTYATGTSITQAAAGGGILNLLSDYQAQLQPFRKLRWNL